MKAVLLKTYLIYETRHTLLASSSSALGVCHTTAGSLLVPVEEHLAKMEKISRDVMK